MPCEPRAQGPQPLRPAGGGKRRAGIHEPGHG
nr:MAG TPA_asm: hypothetical protein [Caudoviricetes sp.]